jgi:hypothetical protein
VFPVYVTQKIGKLSVYTRPLIFPLPFHASLPITLTPGSIGSMSSTGYAGSSTSSSRFKDIFESALNEYTRQTGIDLTECEFAEKLEGCSSPDDVLRLFEVKAHQFKEYREGNRRLINWMSTITRVVHLLAGSLGEGLTSVGPQINHPCPLLFERFTHSTHLHQEKQSLLLSMFSSSYVSSLLASTGTHLHILY